MNKKTTIHEFNPSIYPRRLWVVKGGTLEGIKEVFECSDNLEMDGQGAVTFGVRRKEDSLLGYCVWFPQVGDMRKGDWIAHESSHVAMCIFNDVGATVQFDNQEPFAYLVGWAFECMDKVRKTKEVVNNGSTTGEQGYVEGVQSQEACEEKEEGCRNG